MDDAFEIHSDLGLVITDGWTGFAASSPQATLDGYGSAWFNDAAGDYDFRVEGMHDMNTLFVDADTDSVGIGTSTPQAKLDVRGSAIFNEEGVSGYDFRVEGDTDQYLFYVDGPDNKVGIGTNNPQAKLDVNGDINIRSGGILCIADCTPGCIPFFDGSSQIAEDTSNLVWDDTNNRLGIGTNSPSFPMDMTDTLDNVEHTAFNLDIQSSNTGSPA